MDGLSDDGRGARPNEGEDGHDTAGVAEVLESCTFFFEKER
jgi:hypothetical protein